VTGERWSLGDSLLEIPEHGTVLADAALIASISPEVWSKVGLGVRRELGDAAGEWRVSAGQYVGVARLGPSAAAPQLAVRPKLGADIFFMADYAFEAQRDLLAEEQLRADLAALRDEPAACLLAWFLAEAESFTERWLRRDYIVRREVFEGSVRGRLVVGEYVGRFLARAQAHRAPCQFFDLTQNNLPNQILKAAVRHVSKLAGLLPVPEARGTIQRRAKRVLPLLIGVSDISVQPGDYNRLRLRGALRHYRPMISKCRAMLEGLYLSTEAGEQLENSFLWDMNSLFQETVRGVLRQWPGGALVKDPASARILRPDGSLERRSKVDPDFILNVDRGRLLLDAKYKNTRRALNPNEEAEFAVARSRIRVSRGDVYQAISYGQHDRFRPAVVGLVYPVALEEEEDLPRPYRITGFTDDVVIIFIDVGPYARANLPDFYELLDNLERDKAEAPSLELSPAS
jgi:5-methylcytosine-specific restriction enzyme subunit McrC